MSYVEHKMEHSVEKLVGISRRGYHQIFPSIKLSCPCDVLTQITGKKNCACLIDYDGATIFSTKIIATSK